ncbi:alanine--tRNA ligase, partial [Candidatus Omnitrophota bacterium]
MNTDAIRKEFLTFFKSQGHKLVVSDTLVPKEDPTLLFTSAGMNQFKDYFLGNKKDITRAASCQKCLRTGDLERVGKTSYHHTFFEMLGNFSFGDYFKEETITWAWQFLTGNVHLSEKDLWVSVYLDDQEAYAVWEKKIGVPREKIYKFGAEDNFWPSNALQDGPDGPCGPCSEIFFDWGKDKGCGKPDCNPSCGCGRFVEVWNLVFTQFNRIGLNKTEPLPSNNIDTGMGLERLASVLQGKSTNFEIDILKPIVDEVAGLLKQKDSSLINAIADHLRAVVFSISDGIYPSNEDRGYVIRRILRRALWYGFSLGKKTPFLYSLVGLVAELFKQPYPEVAQKKDIISKVIRAEEERFLATIDKGRGVLFSYIDEAVENKKDVISGREIFTLYDTYGFPYELTQKIVKEKELKTDLEGFKALLENQKDASRQASKFGEGVFTDGQLAHRPSEFIGHNIEEDKVEACLQDILTNPEGNRRALILDKTPFYPTSGGQLHDKGIIENDGPNPFLFEVEDVQKVGDSILHWGVFKKGDASDSLDLKLSVRAVVNMGRRAALARAHTSTHLLQ